ncbi:MAG: S24/S26 family peptidase [Armatimonadetes bacterium]|nr:S24/S26 family peptidase [Armatimonadota bacterium]
MKPTRRIWLILTRLGEAAILAAGAAAVLMLVSTQSPRPPVCLAVVDGRSMVPTLWPGEEVLFVRGPWHPGSIVLADVGEDDPVVKRVLGCTSLGVVLAGDNRETTEWYAVEPEDIWAVMLFKMPFRSPWANEVTATGREQ